MAKKREAKKGLIPWWSLHWPRTPELFTETKIIMRQTSDCIRATLDENGYYSLNSLLVLKLKKDVAYSYKFVLAVLNSTLNNYIYRNLTQEKGRTFAEVKPKNVRKLFIPQISEEEQKPYEQLVSDILDGVIEKEEGMAKIDQKLYDFYQLSNEEILEVKGVDK